MTIRYSYSERIGNDELSKIVYSYVPDHSAEFDRDISFQVLLNVLFRPGSST